ncbi:MAG: CHASE2 domain-containing protein [Candidatus Omnitrophota bacterium]
MFKFKKPTILIIDDDPAVRSYLNDLLKSKGFLTYLASDGQEALEKIKKLKIQIVLCDIKMPKLNGIDFLKATHKLNLNVQVTIMTGVYDLESCNEAVKYAICGYLIKPFSSEELMKSITLAQRNILEKHETTKHAMGQLKEGKHKYILSNILKKIYLAIPLTLLLCAILVPLVNFVPFSGNLRCGIYDQLQKTENILKGPPEQINQIVLVLIDNQTIEKISQSWPYPRSVFAQVIKNIKAANPKIIALDFTFIGNSDPKEDDYLKEELSGGQPIILGYGIDEASKINFSTLPQITSVTSSGFVNSLQDHDGVARRGLTYLKSENNPKLWFLSWEMQVLKTIKGINYSTFIDDKTTISFKNSAQEEWEIPVDPQSSSFLIRFRAKTEDFKQLSFVQVLNHNFNPLDLKDKIVFLGINSTLLGDYQNVPIGKVPGIILKANSFLTLYAHNFLKIAPVALRLGFLILGIFLMVLAFFFLKNWRRAAVAGLLVFLFFILSYVFFSFGLIWNYAVFPSVLVLTYLLLSATQNIWKFPA